MTFESFIDTYTADMKNRLKENTWHTKEHIIRTKLLPYFAKRKMNSIQPKDIIAWQNEMIKCRDKSGEAYSPVYLKTLHNQLSAMVQAMSSKNRDEHNRWRSKTVAFRVSPEEDAQIERYVQLSGLTKQDYITRRLTHKDVVVQGNPKVYKALRDQLSAVLDELRRIEAGQGVSDELLDTIRMITTIMNGMQEEFAYDR